MLNCWRKSFSPSEEERTIPPYSLSYVWRRVSSVRPSCSEEVAGSKRRSKKKLLLLEGKFD